MSHIAVVIANVVAVTPWPDQGEIAANPSAEPSASNSNETDAATNAPAMMAGQEAADSRRADSARGSNVCSISFSVDQWCEHIASNRMIGRGTPSNQSKIPRPMIYIPLYCLRERRRSIHSVEGLC
jgi:hypothetical protein